MHKSQGIRRDSYAVNVVIEENLLTKYKVIDPSSVEGKRIHEFLRARAHRLANTQIDFDKTPVTFLFSDTEQPNAFFMQPSSPEERPRSGEYPKRLTKNPLSTPVVCVSRGLINMVDNLDQLDFVLGHELTHMIVGQKGRIINTKGEEEISDLHAIDLMHDAGTDPKQALSIMKKIQEHAAQWNNENADEKSRDQELSELFDPHMTYENRISAIEGSLTKRSHLISQRQPTAIDKSAFEATYTDQVDEFLKANSFHEKEPIEKLEILVSCIAHLQRDVPAEHYFQEQLEHLSQYKEQATDPKTRERLETNYDMWQGVIRQEQEAGYPRYYSGPVVEKRYQRKIAELTESVIRDNPNIDTSDLLVDVIDGAYDHILEHGYPDVDDRNWIDASGILYSYFYLIFHEHSRTPDQPSTEPRIHKDIATAREKLLQTDTKETFMGAFDEFQTLEKVLSNITGSTLGTYKNKLDDLSDHTFKKDRLYTSRPRIYPEITAGKTVPWNTHVKLAQNHDEVKERVIGLLKRQHTDDYRLTLDMPYVLSKGIYEIDEDGICAHESIPRYEFNYIRHKDTVHEAYDYIREYLEDEQHRGIEVAKGLSEITEDDFLPPKDPSTHTAFNDASYGNEQAYQFFAMFNSMPSIDHEETRRSDDLIIDFIPLEHREAHPIPGANDRINSSRAHGYNFVYDTDLLAFDNPIFVAHFGANYDEKIIEKKEALRDQMFGHIIPFLDRAIEIWENAAHIKNEGQLLYDELKYKQESDLSDTEKQALSDFRKYSDISTRARNVIFSTLTSIHKNVSNDGIWQQKLSQDQKATLARYVVDDQSDVFIRLFNSGIYESFYDHLGVMREQIDHVTNGDYEYTDRIDALAQKYGYERAQTPDDFKAFADQQNSAPPNSKSTHYTWHLHALDALRLLEKSPVIDVNSLCTTLRKISDCGGHHIDDAMPDIKKERHENYIHLMKDGRLLERALQAIDHPENYQKLDQDQLTETARNLSFIDRIIESDDLGNKDAAQTINTQIKRCLELAEEKTLKQSDALAKIKEFHRLFDITTSGFSYCAGWSGYKTKAKVRLQNLSENEAFWPDDIQEHTEALIFAKEAFIDSQVVKDTLLNQLYEKLENHPAGDKKDECLKLLLDQSMRAAQPETRQRLFNICTQNIVEHFGKDDGSETYKERLSQHLKKFDDKPERIENSFSHHFTNPLKRPQDMVSGKIAIVDRQSLMRLVADNIVSQEQTSFMLRENCAVKLDAIELLKSHLVGIGVDYITGEIDRDPEIADEFMEFLSSNGEQSDCEEISQYIEKKARAKTKNAEQHEQAKAEKVIKNTQPAECRLMYENFWAMPLENRAAFIARLLKSSTQANMDNSLQEPWERGFNIVMDKVIPADNPSVEDRYAKDIMHSYIKSHDDYERMLNLSAMMVASRNTKDHGDSSGKALRLFLENKGPAEIKVGQAIASHPSTPDNIATELQDLKDHANKPTRWEIYDWIRTEKIPDEYWKDQHLGEILGAASYYTTIALGEKQVIRLLRPEAREKADKGFRMMGAAIDDLNAKEPSSDLDYTKLTQSMQDMVGQARRMARIETDHEIGAEQYQTAKTLSDGVSLTTSDHTFSLRVMDWRSMGRNWIIMDRAKGVTFNALPEETTDQITYKKQFAKSYIKFEISTILSGKRFDHDRHGGQLCIDPETNEVGLFDTGAMAVRDPLPEEQKQLGRVLYETIKATKDARFSAQHFDHILSKKIADLHDGGQDSQYLVEVRKGLLALGDFFNVLDQKDIQDIMPGLDILSEMSDPIREGLTESMSWADKLKLSFKVTVTSPQKNDVVKIMYPDDATPPSKITLHDNNASSKESRAQWLEETFSRRKGSNTTTPGHSSPPSKKDYMTLQ